MITPAFVVALMSALSPSAPTTGNAAEFAVMIAEVASHDATPIGWTREAAAANLVVYGHAESRFVRSVAPSDRGWSHCAFSVRAAPGSAYARLLESSALACTRAALATMRASVKMCGGSLDGYCGSCAVVAGAARSRAATAIAEKRAREAQGILDAVTMANAPP